MLGVEYNPVDLSDIQLGETTGWQKESHYDFGTPKYARVQTAGNYHLRYP
jgi:hypothetical protein